MNWQGLRRKTPWPDIKYYLSIYPDGLRKRTETSVGVVGVSGEIRTEYLQNISVTS
jgi:hypothetical protein